MEIQWKSVCSAQMSILCNRAETWRMSKTMLRRIGTFAEFFWGIQCMWKVSNKDLRDRERTNQIQLNRYGLRKRKWNITKQPLMWNRQCKRKRGDQNTWRRDLLADITQVGLSWQQLERIAQDRRRWREVVPGRWVNDLSNCVMQWSARLQVCSPSKCKHSDYAV